MIEQPSGILKGISGLGGQGASASVQGASYQAALQAARTDQERTFALVMQREHERLGRAPTVKELKAALAGSPLAELSKDRLCQIQRDLRGEMPEGVEPLVFTRDRPMFRHLNAVRAEYARFFSTNKQPPSFAKLQSLLAEAGVGITETSLINILKRLRRADATEGHGFRLSRQRISVTTAQIEEAYGKAAEYLRQVQISKPPTAVLVAYFLRRAGHRIRRDALEHRFKSVDELKALPLSKHFDPGNKIVVQAHKRLRRSLGRCPTVKELAAEYNSVSLIKVSPDSVWMRVSRLNKSRPASRRLEFSGNFGSNVYDVDLKNAAQAAEARLGRAPTLQELRSELLSSVQGSDISADALHRRSRRLGIALTSEYRLTQGSQLLVATKIQELHRLFGRRPFGAEVREALRRDGTQLSQHEFNSTLGSSKRYRGDDFRAMVRLGFPGHMAGKLRQEYEALRRSLAGYPGAADLAKRLGWTVAGVESALPVAQARAGRLRFPPVVLANTPQAGALGALESIVRQLAASLAEGEPSMTRVSKGEHSVIESMTNGWDLPELPIGQAAASLSFDQKLARCEQWWVLITCMQAPPISIPQEREVEARCAEAKLAKRLGGENPDEDPLEGFVQVLQVAREAGRLSAADFGRIMGQVEASTSVAAAYAVFRSELLGLARRCGFPRLRFSGKR